jgi:hypothetical protein
LRWYQHEEKQRFEVMISELQLELQRAHRHSVKSAASFKPSASAETKPLATTADALDRTGTAAPSPGIHYYSYPLEHVL